MPPLPSVLGAQAVGVSQHRVKRNAGEGDREVLLILEPAEPVFQYLYILAGIFTAL